MYEPLIGGVDALNEPVTCPCDTNGVAGAGNAPIGGRAVFCAGRPVLSNLVISSLEVANT
jgi:hypothetical protein